MKKIVFLILIGAFCSCNNAGTSANANDSSVLKPDTTISPTGVNEGSVISTDTGAYKLNDSSNKK